MHFGNLKPGSQEFTEEDFILHLLPYLVWNANRSCLAINESNWVSRSSSDDPIVWRSTLKETRWIILFLYLFYFLHVIKIVLARFSNGLVLSKAYIFLIDTHHFWSIQKFQIVRIWCRFFFQQRSFFIFTCFKYLKIWNIGVQELFTEFEKLLVISHIVENGQIFAKSFDDLSIGWSEWAETWQ